MGKKKVVATWRDTFTSHCNIVGGILCLGCLIPAVPWRYAQISAHLGARFVNDRCMSPFATTNNMRVSVPWLGLQKKLCDKMKMIQANPMAQMGGLLMNKGAKMMGADKYTGGAMVGCEGWELCKTHVAVRCYAYMTMAYTGLTCMLLSLIGCVSAFLVAVFLSNEAGIKKKKKIEEAKYTTMNVAIVAFIGNFLGTFIWILVSHLKLKEMQQSAMYPWQGMFVGGFLSMLGAFMNGFGCYCGVTRYAPWWDDKKKDGEGEEGEEGGDEAAAPNEAAALAGDPMGGDMPPGMAPPPQN